MSLDKEASAAATLELAKAFIEFVEKAAPGWERAFYRLQEDESRSRVNGSIVRSGEAHLIGMIQHGDAIRPVMPLAQATREATPAPDGRLACVVLLSISNDYNFQVEFEYDDAERWRITKMDGGTGFPQ